MIKNIQCPKCKGIVSEQDYPLHSTYCNFHTSQEYSTPVYDTNNNINYEIDYSNDYNNLNTNINNPIIYTNENELISSINNNDSRNDVNTINNQKALLNYQYPQQIQSKTQQQKPRFRPKTVTYYNNNLNQKSEYSQSYENQSNNFQTMPPQSTNNYSNSIYTDISYPNQIYQNTSDTLPIYTNYTSTYKCNTCGKAIPIKEQSDHQLSHKLEQEEKDRLQAQRLQDEDMFENLSQEQVEEQRKIEENIVREQTQRQNNNFNNINNFGMNGFNINEINDNMRMNNIGNLGNLGGMNFSGLPNFFNRMGINNNGINNLPPGFLENFLNRNMNNAFMNGPSSTTIRRIVIPMGNHGGMTQNEYNDFIDRMIHYHRDNPTDATVVSELPETKIDDIKKLDNDKKNCVICMEDFKNGDKSTNLPCLHMFHTDCIQNWLKKQNTCPICKFKLTQDNISNINRS